jgi:cytochrome c-type biogenesis protein CcmE
MSHARTKIIIAAVAIIGAVGYLAIAGARSGWVYYVQVDELLASADYADQRVRLCGRVDEANFDARPAALTARFDVLGAEASVTVVYRGVVPARFEPGADVVLEGKLDDAGVFQADFLMTKCASKYQAEEHAKRLEQAP